MSPRRLKSNGLSDAKFVGLLLAVSLALNVALGWSLWALRRSAAEASQSGPVGGALSIVSLWDLNGDQREVHFDSGKPTVIYVLSPTCRWCDRNMDNIKALANARSETFRFVGLSLDERGLREYVQRSGLQFSVYSIRHSNILSELQLGSTPQTIVTLPGGTVAKNWIGAYDGELRHEIEKYFQVDLPGLTPSLN